MPDLSKLKLTYYVPILIMVALGVLFAVFRPVGNREDAPEDSVPRVTDGRNYYVFVRSLEVAPKKPSGEAWDRGDEAPDLSYEVHWRDNQIFSSGTQKNQLIGNWSPIGVDTMAAIREGRISIDSVIQAAAIRASPDESFEISVLDRDPISNDDVATLTFKFSELKEGDNVFDYGEGTNHSITHLRLAVVNADLPLVGQVEQILNPLSPMTLPPRLLPGIILLATVLLGLGSFGPCMKIVPGFGDYSPLVRVLKPDLAEPTSFSLFSGITHMAHEGNWMLAILVFSFSIIFPIAKLSVYWIAAIDSPDHPVFHKIMKVASVLGKFSMVDVFVIALLVVAIKGLPGNTQVQLQWGFWCFCLAILVSLVIPFALKSKSKG